MKKLLFVFVFLFSMACGNLSASHLISYELTYEYLGDSNYLIRAEWIDWCGGTIWSGGNPNVPTALSAWIGCPGGGGSNQFSIPLQNTSELPIFGPNAQALNSCGSAGNNGYTGFQLAVYETTINLASYNLGCDQVRISYTAGARISTINVSGTPNYHTWIDIDLQDQSTRASSESFRFDIPGAFLDSAGYSFSVAKFDADGDSLTYEFDTVWASSSYIAFYNSGYSFNTPVPNLGLNLQTGQINVQTEIPIGYDHAPYLINIRTDEWDSESGDFKGSTYRDMVLFVLPFADNFNPQFQGMQNAVGAKQIDSMNLRVCVGDTFSFEVTFDDPDIGDTVFVSSNLEFIADYYNVNQTGINPTTATISALINKEYGYGFDAIVKGVDSHNPMIGQTSRSIHIQSVGPRNETILGCYTNLDTVNTIADSISNWTVLSGDTMNAQNFICLNTSCTSAQINPFNNTTYLVENYMTGNCSFTDTIVVLTDPTVLIGQALDTAQNPVISSKVYRFQYDSGLDSVYVLDSTTTDAAGFYTFALGVDSFLLKVSPDSATYPMLLPTYYDAKVVVPMADFVYPDYCDTLELIHEVLSGVNLGGPGFIEGIVSQGAGRAVGDPVPNVEIILMDANEDPVEYTKTDIDGQFRFENLVNGDYYVYVDRWLIQNNIAPMITLTEEYNEVDDLEFILYSNRLELIKPKGIGEEDEGRFRIYPNPTGQNISVSALKTVDYAKVVDVLGKTRMIQYPNSTQFDLDLNSLRSGIYFIELYADDLVLGKQKVILQK